MAVLSVPDEFRPESNLSRWHYGVVVKNNDPDNIGRIKAIIPGIYESDDVDILPWLYPKEPHFVRGDYGSFRVPDLMSQVRVEFSENDVYTGYYTFSNTNVKTSSELIRDFDGAETQNVILLQAWVTPTKKVNWVRIDKEKNTFQLFMGDAPTYVQIDVKGNIHVSTAGNVDLRTDENVGVKAKNIVMQATENVSINAEKDITVQAEESLSEIAGDDMTMESGADMYTQSGGRMGIESGEEMGIKVGDRFSIDVEKDMGIEVGGTMGTQASGDITRDASRILDNEGATSSVAGAEDVEAVDHSKIIEDHNTRVEAIVKRSEMLAKLEERVQELAEKMREFWKNFVIRYKGRKL